MIKLARLDGGERYRAAACWHRAISRRLTFAEVRVFLVCVAVALPPGTTASPSGVVVEAPIALRIPRRCSAGGFERRANRLSVALELPTLCPALLSPPLPMLEYMAVCGLPALRCAIVPPQRPRRRTHSLEARTRSYASTCVSGALPRRLA